MILQQPAQLCFAETKLTFQYPERMLYLCPDAGFHIFIVKRLLMTAGMRPELFQCMRAFCDKPVLYPSD